MRENDVRQFLCAAAIVFLYTGIGFFSFQHSSNNWCIQFIDDRLNCLARLAWACSPVLALLALWKKRNKWSIWGTALIAPFILSGLLLVLSYRNMYSLVKQPGILQTVDTKKGQIVIKDNLVRGYDWIVVCQQIPMFAGLVLSRDIYTRHEATGADLSFPTTDTVHIHFHTINHKLDPGVPDTIVDCVLRDPPF